MCCAHAYNVLFGVMLFKFGVVFVWSTLCGNLSRHFFRGCENEREFCGVSFSVCTEEPEKYECFAGYWCRDVDVTVEILSALRYYLGMTFINRGRIALLESRFHFQIEYCNVPTVALFQVRNLTGLLLTCGERACGRVADCWRLDVSGLICVRSTKY